MNIYRLAKSLLFLLIAMVASSLPALAQYNQGYGNGPIISCNSNDMRRHYCNIGSNRGVRVYRQHSDSACIEGRSYGVSGSQMWVDRGCRAEFQVIKGGGGGHGGGWNGGGSSTNVYCASDNMRRNYCSVGNYRNIRLVKKRSDAPCNQGSTYGYDRNGIWVDRGCRAEFEVFR